MHTVCGKSTEVEGPAPAGGRGAWGQRDPDLGLAAAQGQAVTLSEGPGSTAYKPCAWHWETDRMEPGLGQGKCHPVPGAGTQPPGPGQPRDIAEGTEREAG